ncbi:hypothetical protein SynMEDNS5_01813 [Synechococcus sp. MEDNS5]|uniref:hypothetical protein n=1 Tax=Synechococcus sp. MEDNS5 TaxID=1442554 RepID=UPI001648858E|nr:hypothetical protein [Synechococcus sp. MEDNS5]QNJ06528.1 hypothetical protein SynMEDNS5_01813 [Synechococcus sp. MEDNS5]
MERGFSAGSAFQQGWSGFSKNAGKLVGFTILAAIVWGIINALQVALLQEYIDKPDVSSGPVVLFVGLVLLQTLLGLIISVALFDGGLQAARGATVTIPELLKNSLRFQT